MELSKKDKAIKYVVYCLVLMLCALLQNTAGLFFEIGSARCFFLIPAAVLLGINEDERTAGLIGLFAGMLWDMLCAQHMGFNCIFIMLMCYISSALVSYVFRNTFWVGVVSAVTVSFLYCFMYWLVFMVFSRVEGGAASLGYFYLPCAVYTCVITPILSLIIRSLQNRLNKDIQID